jgi:hypothetical protein
MFVLALKRAACAQGVVTEQLFSVVDGPVRYLYQIA